jgi:uncharacterized protein YbjT (DUF2867 family)
MSTRPERKIVLVAGATGRLGSIVGVLLAHGHRVRAMTRQVDSTAAAGLRSVGADLVYGDFDDRASIEAAAAGVDAVFATGTAHRVGPDGEVRHGKNVADAAAAAGVPHLVYSSGDGASADSPLPLMRAKSRVEEYIGTVGIRHTILAPVYFMENLFNPWNLPLLTAGTFPSPVSLRRHLQQVAIADLVRFAALVIERPDEFAGRRVAIASDQLDAMGAAAAISSVAERTLKPAPVPVDELAPGLRSLFAWLETVGHDVDVESLHHRYPEVGWHRYPDWATSQRDRLADLCPNHSPVAR